MNMETPPVSDELTDPNIIIEKYNGWLYTQARILTGSSNANLDDLVQEGMIAMWKALDSYDPKLGKLSHHLLANARRRMYDIKSGKPYTGQPHRRDGRFKRETPEVLSLDMQLSPDEDGETLGDTIGTNDPNIEAAEMAYHRKEIRAAISRLSPGRRNYVINRFLRDMNDRELREAGSYNPSAWRGQACSRQPTAREQLAEELAHLREVTLYA